LYIILFGAPGVGKGTQAVILAEKTGLVHITTGELFREAIRQQTDLGKQAKVYYDRGQLVPDHLTIAMLLERLSQGDCGGGCILDGFPRTMEQAAALDEALVREGRVIDKVVYIQAPEDELLSRLSGRWNCRQCSSVYHERFQPPREAGRCDQCGGELYQREDDKPETARRRLEVYAQQTAPLIDYYRERGKLLEIDGNKSVEDVAENLVAAVEGS
jgi:adenylate kinase